MILVRGEEIVDYIPGVSSTRLADLPDFFCGNGQQSLPLALDCISRLHKAQYVLFTSFYELESQAVRALTKEIPKLSVYPVGPCIPYFNVTDHHDVDDKVPEYIKWLDSQPRASVLYISLGSFLSVSGTQMEEIISGVRESGVRYLAVSRGETSSSWIKDGRGGDLGMVVPWSDQLRVLRHPSVGGFLSHCGWNSTLEAVFAGVPVLTFPIFWDQIPNSKAIVEDWKIGWRLRRDVAGQTLVSGREIAQLLRTFMDGGNEQVKELRERARELKEVCKQAIATGGSSQVNIDAFLNDL